MKKRRVLFVSLGCPKNQVDGELMLAKLQNAGFENADNFERLDAVIVNTCAFIDSAKQEAIDTILEMVGLKKDGLVRAVIVTGCLAERYRDEILQEIPEVDAVVGIGANGDIDKIVDEVLDGKQTNVFPDKKKLPMCGERVLTTPDYWAYLKIAEGCSNCCTYCAIPSIRGPFRSRDEESIVEEAKTLANGGVKELVLIAQDVSSYGIDIYGEYRLAHLLDLLCEIDGIEWIRLLYCYPDKITDELIDTMASQPKVLHYIDLPLQHADDSMLKAMNRHSRTAEIMFVGEGPGAHEDEQGVPFVGKAGQLLDDMLAIIGLDRTMVYIANIVKCRPPQNRDPLGVEQDACIGYLREQVTLLRPKLIVCLGRIAAMRLIREDFKITREHGQWVKKGGFELMAMYHPAALLRDPARRPDAFEDLMSLREKARAVCEHTPLPEKL